FLRMAGRDLLFIREIRVIRGEVLLKERVGCGFGLSRCLIKKELLSYLRSSAFICGSPKRPSKAENPSSYSSYSSVSSYSSYPSYHFFRRVVQSPPMRKTQIVIRRAARLRLTERTPNAGLGTRPFREESALSLRRALGNFRLGRLPRRAT